MRQTVRLWFWVSAAVMASHTLGVIAGLWPADMALALMALTGIAVLLWVGWFGGPVDYGPGMRDSAFRAALRTWWSRIGGQ